MMEGQYSYAAAGPGRRMVRWTAGIAPITWVLARSLDPMDRAVYKMSRGRHTFTSLFTGLPVVMLTTTGAKTGRQTTVPVVGIPDGEAIAVIASNYGQRRHPAWYHNLTANPVATVTVRGVEKRVRARRVTDHERESLWALGTRIYPAWSAYRRRAANREIGIFVLEND
jgi:deazaflavin-dependent oxidoreductase (nitroreductase family)